MTAVAVMDEVRARTRERLNDPDAIDRVVALEFGNLTAPVLAQMRGGQVWRSLVDIAWRVQEAIANGHRTNGNWGPRVPAGSLQLTVTPRMKVNAALLFTSGPGTVGPDDLRGKRVSAVKARLPDTLAIACKGRRLDEVVDVARYHGAVGPERVRRIERADWGVAIHLDIPFLQPTRADLEAMRDAHDPTTY